MKSKTAAACLAIFLGLFAADAWYLRRFKLAAVYNILLVAFALTVPQFNQLLLLAAIVRGIRLFAMNQQKFDNDFNGGKTSETVGILSRPPPLVTLSSELSELSRLHQQGSLTQEEFNAAKASLLKKKAA